MFLINNFLQLNSLRFSNFCLNLLLPTVLGSISQEEDEEGGGGDRGDQPGGDTRNSTSTQLASKRARAGRYQRDLTRDDLLSLMFPTPTLVATSTAAAAAAAAAETRYQQLHSAGGGSGDEVDEDKEHCDNSSEPEVDDEIKEDPEDASTSNAVNSFIETLPKPSEPFYSSGRSVEIADEKNAIAASVRVRVEGEAPLRDDYVHCFDRQVKVVSGQIVFVFVSLVCSMYCILIKLSHDLIS